MSALDVHGGLLARIIPPMRVVMAMRVCSSWRVDVPKHASNVLLMASQGLVLYSAHDSRAESHIVLDVTSDHITSDLERFNHHGVLVRVLAAGSSHVSEMISKALCNIASVGRAFHLDFSNINFTAIRSDVINTALVRCLEISVVNLENATFGELVVLGRPGSNLMSVNLRHSNALSTPSEGQPTALLDQLRHCHALRRLDISGNSITLNHAKSLALLLQTHTLLDSLECNECQLQPEAAAAIFEVLPEQNSITNLSLDRNNGLLVLGVDKVAQGLRACSHLTDLSIKGSLIGDDGAASVCAALEHCPALRHLDLSSNRLTDKGAAAVSAFLRQRPPALTSLHVGENQIEREGARWLARGLVECTTLSSLSLRWAHPGVDGVDVLAGAMRHHGALRSIDLSHNRMPDQGASCLARALRECSLVTCLNLAHNEIGGEGAAQLGMALRHCPRLAHLELEHNRIGADGVGELAQGLLGDWCCGVQTLDVEHNALTSAGFTRLAHSLTLCSSLSALRLGGNDAKDQGVTAVAHTLSSLSRLTLLSLASNRLADAGATALAAALQRCPSLTDLRLQSNAIRGEGAAALAGGAAHCQGLRGLRLKQNQIDVVGARQLLALLASNPLLRTLDLSHNRIGTDQVQVLAAGLAASGMRAVVDLTSNDVATESEPVVTSSWFSPYSWFQ